MDMHKSPPADGKDGAAALLERIARGDKIALAQLFEREAGQLIAIARRIVYRQDLAEEVVQDAFVAIWQRASLFDASRGTARGWIITIVRNRALNLVRDGKRLDFVDGESLAELGDRHAVTEAAYGALPERHTLRRCLDQLDPVKRNSILLCYVAGMSHGEVAAKLDAPLGTVKAWIRRGVIALQECMA